MSLKFKYALRIHNAYHTHLISINSITFNFFQFISVAQSCPTLCKPLDCSMPCFPVHHQLPELAQTHVHRVCNAIQPSHPVIPFFSRLQSFPASGSFPIESALCIRWPKYWSFSFSISPSSEYSGLNSFRID